MPKIYRFIHDIKLPGGITHKKGDAIIVDNENESNSTIDACKKAEADGLFMDENTYLNEQKIILENLKKLAGQSEDAGDDE